MDGIFGRRSILNRTRNSEVPKTSTPIPDNNLLDLDTMASSDDICMLCKKPFTLISKSGPQNCIQCLYCSGWLCLHCLAPEVTVAAHQASVITSLSKKTIEVHCGKCTKPDVAMLVRELQDAKLQINELSNQIKDIQNERSRHLVEQQSQPTTPIDIQKLIVESIARIIPQAMAEFFSNYQLREKAKTAIVVSGLPQTDTPDDITVTDSLLPQLSVDKSEVDIKNVFRMGKAIKRRDGKTVPPLLKIVFADNDQRNLVLKSGKNLKDAVAFDGVYLRPSMTSQQREVHGKLLGYRYYMKKQKIFLQIRFTPDGDPYLWNNATKSIVSVPPEYGQDGDESARQNRQDIADRGVTPLNESGPLFSQ